MLAPILSRMFFEFSLQSKRVNIKILPVILCVGTHVCMLEPMRVGVHVHVSH